MDEPHYVIVDGSNLATEGRMLPSLAQLEDAVIAYRDEDPSATIIVVVDATFGHRIDEREKARYDEAIDHGELLTPPAGAVGRGDGFILKIADKADAVILSNDSFQEFHGDYPWLFDAGRLVGGKPVPPIGWVFTARSPVRGPKSRAATSKRGAVKPAKKLVVALPEGVTPQIGDVITPPSAIQAAPAKAKGRKRAAAPADVGTAVDDVPAGDAAPPGDESPAPVKRRGAKKAAARLTPQSGDTADAAVARDGDVAKPKKRVAKKAVAPVEPVPAVVETAPARKRAGKKAATSEVEVATPAGRRRAKAEPQATPAPASVPVANAKVVNEAVAFLAFVTTFPVGATLDGVVRSFTSHGAMVEVTLGDGTTVTCYAPTKHLGQPDAKSAKAVVSAGTRYSFTVLGLDPARRVAELALG